MIFSQRCPRQRNARASPLAFLPLSLWEMWQSGQSYNETLHALNQQRHGSWLLQLQSRKS
jgi:hypothetical protein